MDARKRPVQPATFLRECLETGRVLWTYHVNMRLPGRSLTREQLFAAKASLEIIEEYPDDKYLPSFLCRAELPGLVFHVLLAADVDGKSARVVTMYRPDVREWDAELRRRRR